MKYILATYKNKWKNDVLRTYYYLINYLVDNFNYVLLDLSDFDLNSSLCDIVNDVEHIIYIENQ